MFARLRDLRPPRRGRSRLGVAFFAVLLLPGVIVMRSARERSPEHVETPARAPSSFPIDDPTLVADPELETAARVETESPGDTLQQQYAVFTDLNAEAPAEMAEASGEALALIAAPEPVQEPTPEPDARAATELLGIEISTSAGGDHSLIQLRANGRISNAEVLTLSDPDRLVIDIPGMSIAMESSSPMDVGSARIERVRMGTHVGMVRIVFDAGDRAEPFDDRNLEPVRDGLLIALGSEIVPAGEPVESAGDSADDALAEIEPEPQPVASISHSDVARDEISPLVDPAQELPQLPLYILDGQGSDRSGATAPMLEGLHDCIIEPHEVVDVGSALTAVVKSIEVERSDFVTMGQVLAQLESSPERAAVAVAQARATMQGEVLARQARMELGSRKKKRADQLFESETLSVDMRDEVQTEAKVANAALQEARERRTLMKLQHREAIERLDEHTIRSPVSGVVVKRLKSPGEVLKEETILVIAQIDPLQVEVILPAAAFGTVRKGMRAEVTPEIPTAGVQVATVLLVDPVVDGTSGTFGVRLELPNPDHAVPSGLRCQLRFMRIDY